MGEKTFGPVPAYRAEYGKADGVKVVAWVYRLPSGAWRAEVWWGCTLMAQGHYTTDPEAMEAAKKIAARVLLHASIYV